MATIRLFCLSTLSFRFLLQVICLFLFLYSSNVLASLILFFLILAFLEYVESAM
jgi:hypothetical protein